MKPVMLFIPLLLCAFSLPALADEDGERETLARLLHEMQLLQRLVDQAEAQAAPGATYRFRYDWLRQDLARVSLGINQHLLGGQDAPRDIQPLRGDYRR